MTHEGLDSQSHDASTEVFRAGEGWFSEEFHNRMIIVSFLPPSPLAILFSTISSENLSSAVRIHAEAAESVEFTCWDELHKAGYGETCRLVNPTQQEEYTAQ